MPNEKGWHTKEEVLATGLPFYINERRGWTDERYGFAVLLTKSRCKEFGIPILANGNEKPSAFRYAAAAGTGTGDNKHRYYPLYDRTSVFQNGELSLDKLHKHEIMGKVTQKRIRQWLEDISEPRRTFVCIAGLETEIQCRIKSAPTRRTARCIYARNAFESAKQQNEY